MIIDAHVHLMPQKVREHRERFFAGEAAFEQLYGSEKARLADEDDIMRYLDDSGIDQAVVFGFPWQSHDLVRQNNEEIWEFHERHRDRVIPFAVLAPEGRDLVEAEAARVIKAGFRGIGELAVYHGGWTLEGFETLDPVLKMAGDAQIPVVIHVNEPVGHEYPGKIDVDYPGLLRIIESNPDVDFILAHFGGGIFVYGLMPEIARILRRTYLDTAAGPYLYQAKVFEVVRSIMGPDKLLFGSDYPLLGLKRYLKELDRAGVDGEFRRGILGGNLQRLLQPR
ncbi:MAG: amidohydrolase family protein [Thermodesulfobacteriota bacterium]